MNRLGAVLLGLLLAGCSTSPPPTTPPPTAADFEWDWSARGASGVDYVTPSLERVERRRSINRLEREGYRAWQREGERHGGI